MPLLWSMVMVELLWELNDNDNYTVGYGDGIAILITGEHPQTVPKILQRALCIVQQLCDWTNLSINHNKMVIIPFTRKRDIRGLREKADGQGNQKGLQGLLDMQRHSWENLGIESEGDVLDICCGCTTHSHLCYHCVGQFKANKAELSKLQRMAWLNIAGTMRTAPMAAIEVLLVPPHCTCS